MDDGNVLRHIVVDALVDEVLGVENLEEVKAVGADVVD